MMDKNLTEMSICKDCFHSYVCERFNERRGCDNTKCHFFNDHFVPTDLIDRLQAEKEDYKALYEGLKAEHIETIKAIKHYKAEAYKEFAERLKKEQYLSIVAMVVSVEAIDNLLKELVGGDV